MYEQYELVKPWGILINCTLHVYSHQYWSIESSPFKQKQSNHILKGITFFYDDDDDDDGYDDDDCSEPRKKSVNQIGLANFTILSVQRSQGT